MINAHDIETIPNESLLEFLPEPELALGNTKDPEKIEGKRQEAKNKQIEKMALNPYYGRMCSYSIHGEDKSEFKVIDEISDAAEIELINHALENLTIATPGNPNIVVTWNGYYFDIPYIYKRAALLRVPLPNFCPPMNYWLRRYSHEPHCDLELELCGWNQEKKNSLDDTGKRFLGRGKTERDYSTYIELIKSGKGELIGLDNLCDTTLTYDLYKYLAPYLF
jgi:predicted PolB exonuclease-like 3'-5' exonuclease